MQLSNDAIKYIQSLNVPHSLNSNFLICDLEKIIYVDTDGLNEYYNSKPLSNDILSIINEWYKLPLSEKLFLIENQPNIKIIDTDEKKYSAIMIFPIYIQENLQRTYNLL